MKTIVKLSKTAEEKIKEGFGKSQEIIKFIKDFEEITENDLKIEYIQEGLTLKRTWCSKKLGNLYAIIVVKEDKDKPEEKELCIFDFETNSEFKSKNRDRKGKLILTEKLKLKKDSQIWVRENKKYIYSQLGRKCTKCGKIGDLTIHHKEYKIGIENLEILCHECHKELHGKLNGEKLKFLHLLWEIRKNKDKYNLEECEEKVLEELKKYE